MKTYHKRWGILWHTHSPDGHKYSLQGGLGKVFNTRREAQKAIESEYHYIRTREDLRGSPHYWRMPIAVKVLVTIDLIDACRVPGVVGFFAT